MPAKEEKVITKYRPSTFEVGYTMSSINRKSERERTKKTNMAMSIEKGKKLAKEMAKVLGVKITDKT